MKSRIFQREGEMFFLKLQYAENNKSCIYLDNVVWNIYSTSLSFFFFFLFNEKFYVLLFIREKKGVICSNYILVGTRSNLKDNCPKKKLGILEKFYQDSGLLFLPLRSPLDRHFF